jgi:hypothetical protein
MNKAKIKETKEILVIYRNMVNFNERFSRCPFQYRNSLDILFRDCTYCNDILGLMPPRIPYAVDSKSWPSVNYHNSCPCQRFGLDYVALKIKEWETRT